MHDTWCKNVKAIQDYIMLLAVGEVRNLELFQEKVKCLTILAISEKHVI